MKTNKLIAGLFTAALACTLHTSTQAGVLTDMAKSATQSSELKSAKKTKVINYLDHIEVIKGADFNEALSSNDKDAGEIRNALYQAVKYARKDPELLAALKGPVETVLGLEEGSLSPNFTNIRVALLNW